MSNPAPVIPSSLAGHLLIATPSLGDNWFDRSVILLCSHDPDQAFGLVLNKPEENLKLPALFKQMSVAGTKSPPSIPALIGGPVDNQRGFVVHSAEYRDTEESMEVAKNLIVTPTLGALKRWVSDAPLEKAAFVLGYSGWGAGQLDDEIKRNAWLVAPLSDDIIFGTNHASKWTSALALIGVSPQLLSPTAGHA